MSQRAVPNMDEPADNTKTLPFECTMSECIMRFGTVKEMKLHKTRDPAHFYCKRCDVDCVDWDDLVQHKVTAMSPWLVGANRGNLETLPQHIVCEFCGEDFKSFGGRRLHRNQYHPAEQNIVCPMETCARYFTKAAFFIRHLEDGECKEITAREFNSYVLAKHVRKQIDGNFDYIKDKFNENKALALSANLDVSTYGTSEDDTVSEYSTEGGVELIDQDYPDQAGGLQPLLREFDLIDINYQPTSPSSSTADGWPGLTRAPSVSGSEMSASAFASYITTNKMSSSATSVCSSRRESRRPTERWPSLSSAASTQSVVSDCDDDDAASDTTTTPVPSNRHTAWRSSNTSDILFPGVRPRPVTEEEQLAALEPTKNMNTTRWWDPDHEDFDPEGFFSESNLSDHVSYCCIFPECDDAAGYEDLDSLKAHLKHAHLRVVHICPAASCYKRFAKASSLLAHTESNSKCKVQGADFYKRLVGDISGGLLDAKSMPVPKIWKPEQSMILAGGDTQLNGLMPTKFEVSRPETIW